MKKDYTASLTVYGLGAYTEKEMLRLTQWLRNKADQIEESEPLDWSTVRATFRLMK